MSFSPPSPLRNVNIPKKDTWLSVHKCLKGRLWVNVSSVIQHRFYIQEVSLTIDTANSQTLGHVSSFQTQRTVLKKLSRSLFQFSSQAVCFPHSSLNFQTCLLNSIRDREHLCHELPVCTLCVRCFA